MGPMEEDPYSDAALIRAARKRLLSELEPAMKKAESSANHASVVNNVYGGGHGAGDGGLMDRMGGGGSTPAGEGEDPFSYFVDVTRKDLPDINPATGKPMDGKSPCIAISRSAAKKKKKVKPGTEHHQTSAQEFYNAITGQVDPAAYAGEGFTSTEEIPRAEDIDSPWVRGRIGHEEEYWPGPKPRRKR